MRIALGCKCAAGPACCTNVCESSLFVGPPALLCDSTAMSAARCCKAAVPGSRGSPPCGSCAELDAGNARWQKLMLDIPATPPLVHQASCFTSKASVLLVSPAFCDPVCSTSCTTQGAEEMALSPARATDACSCVAAPWRCDDGPDAAGSAAPDHAAAPHRGHRRCSLPGWSATTSRSGRWQAQPLAVSALPGSWSSLAGGLSRRCCDAATTDNTLPLLPRATLSATVPPAVSGLVSDAVDSKERPANTDAPREVVQCTVPREDDRHHQQEEHQKRVDLQALRKIASLTQDPSIHKSLLLIMNAGINNQMLDLHLILIPPEATGQ